jgi:enamine deaminase RidA (YjgF/YER057c/UK114 family)
MAQQDEQWVRRRRKDIASGTDREIVPKSDRIPMNLGKIVKTTFFLTRREDLPMLGEVRRRRWGSDMPAAVTVIVVAGLARPDALVEVEAIAAAVEP